MKTITFYSFKGGVGRSLTLSNMALWLADEMKAKVCVIDFDLEAPGLPYKFEDLQNPADQERLSRTEGIVEYIDEFKQTGIPPADFTRFYLPFTTKKGNPISLIPAGNLQQSDYWRKLFEINWQKLFEHDPAMGYSQGLLLLEDLKGRIENELKPDFLLIDSRTGLTEIASITLKLLADKAVLVGINNPENQDGLFWVLRSLHADPASRDLPYHLVLNRVPMQHGAGRREIDPREKAIGEQFLKRFETLAPLETLAERFSIIHADDELAFGEKLQEGFYVEAQSKVQTRKDYWDVFTQVVKEYFNSEQWAIFENKRKAYELYYKAKFDTLEIREQIDLMNAAISCCGDDAFLYNFRFTLFNDINYFEDALNDIELAIKIAPENAICYYNLSVLYANKQDYFLSIDALNKATKLMPDMYEAWYNLGVLYDKTQDFTNAIIAYQNAINSNPEMHQAWNNLGVIYNTNQNFDRAIEAFLSSLRIQSDKKEAWYNLGIAYFKNKNYDLAINAYKKTIDLNPKDDAWGNLGEVYFNQRKYKLAIEAYQEALKIKPNRYDIWRSLGIAFFNNNDNKSAIEAHKKALKIKPNEHEMWSSLGTIYATQKDYASAINSYNRALKIKSDDKGVWYNLAYSLIYLSYKQKNKSKLLKEALHAAQKSQQLGGKVYHLACVYALLKDYKQALQWLQEAFKREEITVEQVKKDQDFASLREDEEFKALLARFSS